MLQPRLYHNHAPQSRNVKAGPQRESERFDLKPGRKVQGRLVDDAGEPVPGACVVLNRWHVHTDADGHFDWSVEGSPLENVEMKAYKRYDGRYGQFKGTETVARVERGPLRHDRKGPWRH